MSLIRVVYYALQPLKVGDEIRQVGDLVPEAHSWPFLSGYVTDGRLAPVLVATLPEETQAVLLEWEQDQFAVETGGDRDESEPKPDEQPDEDTDENDSEEAEPQEQPQTEPAKRKHTGGRSREKVA